MTSKNLFLFSEPPRESPPTTEERGSTKGKPQDWSVPSKERVSSLISRGGDCCYSTATVLRYFIVVVVVVEATTTIDRRSGFFRGER